MSSTRFRIAPTPSGFLHLGNAFSFLLTYLLCRSAGGSLRLRIDDLDAPRVRTGFVTDIFETLQWLGISWEEGPATAEEAALYSQNRSMDRYEALLAALVSTGTVFACTCSRRTIQSQSPDGQYTGACRYKNLPLDTPDACWRIMTPESSLVSFDDQVMGPQTIDLFQTNRDFVVRRRDGIPAYQVSSLADDLHFCINRIVRGEDLVGSTAAQLHLAGLLGANAFEQALFYHHPLLKDEQGQKRSKSAGSASIRSFREGGGTPEAVYRIFAGWVKDAGMNHLLPGHLLQALNKGKKGRII